MTTYAGMGSLDDLATQVIFGSFKDAQRNPYIYSWLNTRYARIWTSMEWAFKIVEPTVVSTLAGNRYLGAAGAANVLPTDFGEVRQLYDETGRNEIMFLEEATFNHNYLAGRIQGQTGKPEAFTVVNRKIILGPVPDAVYTYYIGYKRLLGYDLGNVAGGQGTFKVGLMGQTDVAKDKPYWPAEHFEVLVVGARALGLKLVNDSAWFGLEQQHDDLVQGMIADGLLHDESIGSNRSYGRDRV